MSTKKEHILFVFEGDAERRLNNSIFRCFEELKDIVITSVFKNNIYELYGKLLDENGEIDEDIDLYLEIKKRNLDELQDFDRDNFREIYLFFDYDAHTSVSNDEVLAQMLDFFSNETENGRLLISYPMLEAIKHLPNKEVLEFKDLCVNCSENKHGDENLGYKTYVAKNCCDNQYLDYRKYDIEKWKVILNLHICKMNYIVNNTCSFPKLTIGEIIPQNQIFENQLQKYITPQQKVGVLSAFPIFIHDYFGNQKTLELIQATSEDKT